MHIKVLDRDKLPIRHTLDLAVVLYDAYATWGPWTATIEARGSQEAMEALRHWIGYYLIVYNDNGSAVWWGKITRIDAPFGDYSIGVSFGEMYNRAQILYSYTAGNTVVNAATAWAEDSKSVAAFGRKEIRHSVGEANANQAGAALTTILNNASLVQMNVSFTQSEAVLLRCEGLGKLLGWRYYSNPVGLEQYAGPDTKEQPIGWGSTATDIGFADRMIQKMGGNLGKLPTDEPIRISGSALNSATKTAAGASTERDTYAANTISFQAGDDILDSASGLNMFKTGTFVQVSGAAANNRVHLLDSAARGVITTSTTVTGAITAAAAGPLVTIVQSSTLSLNEDVKVEAPGQTITLTGPQSIRYSFSLSYNANWPAYEIWIRARAVGSPVDALRVSLYSDSAGALGTLLDTGTISGLSDTMGWVGIALTGAATLVYGATYWIVVDRTGSNSTANYYAVGVEDEGNGAGLYRVWDGAAWSTRGHSLPFQIWGQTITTEQIVNILTAAGQFLDGIDLRVNSGVYERQYRDGSLDALEQLTDLLEDGTTLGGILLARVTQDWRIVIDVAPEVETPYRLLRNRKIATERGNVLEDGLLPVGERITIDGLTGQADGLIANTPYLIGYMEYSARQGITQIEPYGTNSIWDIDLIAQG